MNIVSLNPKKRAYQKEKMARILKQQKIWEGIQTQPENEWAQRLFSIWPSDLPIYLLERVPSHVLAEYNSFCGDRLLFDLFQDDIEDIIDSKKEDSDALAYSLARALLWSEHCEKVSTLLAFFDSLSRPQIVINQADYFLLSQIEKRHNDFGDEYDLPLNDKLSFIKDNFHQTFSFDFHALKGLGREFFEGILCVGMTTSTGIQVETKLPLRALDRLKNGEQKWMDQEKMYGFSLSGGEIYPLDTSDLGLFYKQNEEDKIKRARIIHLGDTKHDFDLFCRKRDMKHKEALEQIQRNKGGEA